MSKMRDIKYAIKIIKFLLKMLDTDITAHDESDWYTKAHLVMLKDNIQVWLKLLELKVK